MEIKITCNTSDEILFKNIEQNSRLALPWVKMQPENDGHAILVGGGPSLASTLDIIRWRQALGQKVFALNNAAKFLKDNGIKVDYSVICDARAENKEFVGYAHHYLLASQCHQDTLFSATYDTTTLWHPAIEKIENYLPEHEDSYALIGGGTSVGLSAMCLAYTMGYRKLHLFGYDSCHSEDKGHAYPQPLNDGEHMATVEVAGRVFNASLTMARQAELFPYVSGNLIDAGCVITVDGDGLIPWIARQPAAPKIEERDKYLRMWEVPEYREISHGEHVAPEFLECVKPNAGAVIADFGCGTGRGSIILAKCNYKPFLIDFTDNSRDEDARKFPFLQWDLAQPLPISTPYGFCCDVLEHIDREHIDAVINNIMACSQKVFFQISLVPDVMGNFIGYQLHLTVEPFLWWVEKFQNLGYKIEWSKDEVVSAMFYITRS